MMHFVQKSAPLFGLLMAAGCSTGDTGGAGGSTGGKGCSGSCSTSEGPMPSGPMIWLAALLAGSVLRRRARHAS